MKHLEYQEAADLLRDLYLIITKAGIEDSKLSDMIWTLIHQIESWEHDVRGLRARVIAALEE